MGLFRTFAEEGAPRMNVYVNDCDEDVALSVWLLKNHESIENPKFKRKIERLVRAADLLDATAGAFPLDPNSKIMRMTAWIFEPFKVARAADRIHGMTGQEMALMLEEVGARITSFVSSSGEQRELDTRYVEHGKNNGWSLIQEIGSEGRNGFFHDGGKAFISFRQNTEQRGVYAYTISRLSPYIDFPITEIYSELNKAEGIQDGSPNSWGGSEIIGGSPRSTGSRLTPNQILNILNDYLSKRSGIIS